MAKERVPVRAKKRTKKKVKKAPVKKKAAAKKPKETAAPVVGSTREQYLMQAAEVRALTDEQIEAMAVDGVAPDRETMAKSLECMAEGEYVEIDEFISQLNTPKEPHFNSTPPDGPNPLKDAGEKPVVPDPAVQASETPLPGLGVDDSGNTDPTAPIKVADGDATERSKEDAESVLLQPEKPQTSEDSEPSLYETLMDEAAEQDKQAITAADPAVPAEPKLVTPPTPTEATPNHFQGVPASEMVGLYKDLQVLAELPECPVPMFRDRSGRGLEAVSLLDGYVEQGLVEKHRVSFAMRYSLTRKGEQLLKDKAT